MQWENNR